MDADGDDDAGEAFGSRRGVAVREDRSLEQTKPREGLVKTEAFDRRMR